MTSPAAGNHATTARPRHSEARAIWEHNAAFWDDHIGPQGNAFHRHLVAPATWQLLQAQAGERVLDIACGNGQFARQLAGQGVVVDAFDIAPTFIERARAHTAAAGLETITYHILDATDEVGLLSLGVGQFDAAVSNMALMDIADIDPLLRATYQLLKPGGRFVFSIMHPCFNHSGAHLMAEQDDRSGEVQVVYGVKVVRYLSQGVALGVGIEGQPRPQYYFNRTLTDYVMACVRAGFVVNGLAEPAFGPGEKGNRALSWANFSDIPAVLVMRCTKLS